MKPPRIGMPLLFAVSVTSLLACTGLIGGLSIETVDQDANPEAHLRVMTSLEECRGRLGLEEAAAASDCVPILGGEAGDVRLAFDIIDKVTADPIYVPLQDDAILLTHDDVAVSEFDIVRHETETTPQLFVVLIGGSGSMHEPSTEQGPITDVYKGLLDATVVDGFFPKSSAAQRGVVLLRFTDRVTSIDGGAPRVITSRKEYKATVTQHLLAGDRGSAHLYDAATYAMTDLMVMPSIQNWMELNVAEPTVIAITDGFNNPNDADTCGSNAPRLQAALEDIHDARSGPVGLRPVLHTVGLGGAYNAGWTPSPPPDAVTAGKLCSKDKDAVIDGGVEKLGFDNVSLSWMAAAGSGMTAAADDHKALAASLTAISAPRSRWYEVRYIPDSLGDAGFETGIALGRYTRAGATVTTR